MEEDKVSIARLDERIKESNKNVLIIIEDIRKLFQKSEEEAKANVLIRGELRSHIEADKNKWESKAEVCKRVQHVIDSHEKNIDEEIREREKFEIEIKSHVRNTIFLTAGIVGVIGLVATLLSIFIALRRLY